MGSADDTGKCICEGNWRKLVSEYEHLIGKEFKDSKGTTYTFFGLVHSDDDYYFGLYRSGRLYLASCVGDLENYGYELVEDTLNE